MPLVNKLHECRQQRGLSLRDVATAVGVDAAQLHRVERQIGGFSDEKKLALAEFFDISVEDLFFQQSVDKMATSAEVPA